jgi:hypothetical protein
MSPRQTEKNNQTEKESDAKMKPVKRKEGHHPCPLLWGSRGGASIYPTKMIILRIGFLQS